jgi:hypothetical protein
LLKSARARQHKLGSKFCDHCGWSVGIAGRDRGHNGRIDISESINAADTKGVEVRTHNIQPSCGELSRSLSRRHPSLYFEGAGVSLAPAH